MWTWIIKMFEATGLIMAIFFIIDIQTDGDIDLPHMEGKWKKTLLYKVIQSVKRRCC